jgi:orotate phosphoribosyltransferase
MNDHARLRLLDILRQQAILRGEFTLASGRTSSVYLDCRRATLHPEGAAMAANVLLDWLDAEAIPAQCVGGPTLGADPIVAAMVALSWIRGRPLPGFLVRKEAKGHGTGQQLEGQYKGGWKTVIVEDTVTSGGSLLKAVKAAEDAGLVVVATACLVDREEGAAELLKDHGFRAMFRMSELV